MPPVLHDLDGDGIDDAAVLLAESSGGSGAFTWLAVVSCRDGRAVNTGTIGLGDRVMIRSLGGQEGSIVVEFVAAGPGEPLCCPPGTYGTDTACGTGTFSSPPRKCREPSPSPT